MSSHRLRRLPWLSQRESSIGNLFPSGTQPAANPGGRCCRRLTTGYDRQRLSATWVPTGGISATHNEDAYGKLVRAGFLRQSHSGIFHLLPLGRRVQSKLEGLLDRHMHALGASRVSLSSITSQDLWRRSGRLSTVNSELFCFSDRKSTEYMLSPTHEEEITSLVSKTVKSYKELPLRLYQITRKFRDELRPRHGLLRSREFTMKDLYTFDWSPDLALQTYREVQYAYAAFFRELNLPFLVARASSGDMGGELSHEYHFPSVIGEDTVVSCSSCDYVVNDEIAEVRTAAATPPQDGIHVSTKSQDVETTPLNLHVGVWRGISKDRTILVNAWYLNHDSLGLSGVRSDLRSAEINIHAIKDVVPDLDASIDDPLLLWEAALHHGPGISTKFATKPRLMNLVDFRLANKAGSLLHESGHGLPVVPSDLVVDTLLQQSTVTLARNGNPLNLLRIQEGDACPRCDSGMLSVQKALEVGHTFHLGTRYSEPLGATVSTPPTATANPNTGKPLQGASSQGNDASYKVALQMGCHGIGVTRLIGAVAEHLADDKGLQWPRVIAPYEVVVIPATGLEQEALEVYDAITDRHRFQEHLDSRGMDVILDDRVVSMGWKMKDADLIGYPVIVIVGRAWINGQCEVQCRRLSINTTVPTTALRQHVLELLDKL